VKDTGPLFGAHGGALDRLDAMLFSAVVELLHLARDPGRALMSSAQVVILGATGSIGVQALEVIERSDELELVGLARTARSWERSSSRHALLASAGSRSPIERPTMRGRAWPEGEVLGGPDGIVALILESDADLVLNAVVGSAGLLPTIVTLGEGIDLALANKESLVVGGELVTALAEATGAQIICRSTPSTRRSTS
jgi:1-deoxy-D-xylulose-5-phosphate reductoisomerase